MKIKIDKIPKNQDYEIPENVEIIDMYKNYDYSFLKSSQCEKENSEDVYITYYNKYGNIKKVEKYLYVDPKNIYGKFFNSQELFINLSGCYVENISIFLNKLENKHGDQNDKIVIKEFIAKDAFFHTNAKGRSGGILGKNINFENIRFKDKVDFTNSTFYNNVHFNNIIFECNTEFSYIKCMKNINVSKSIFENDLEIKESTFNGLLRFKNVDIKGKTNFTKSKFKGFAYFLETKFNNISFANSIFKNKTYFKSNVKFMGKANFNRVEFRDLVEFNENIIFESKLNFNYVKCKGVTLFFKTKFSYSEFRHVIFEKKTAFIDCEFKNNVKFWNGKFNGELLFTMSKFNKSAYFNNSTFRGIAYFYNTKTNSELGFERCDFHNYVDLRVKKCGYINLEESINRDILDFRPRKNDKIKIEKINFHNIKNLGFIYIDWNENNVEKVIKFDENENNNKKTIEQYRMLKENFRELGQYESEDNAYVKFKKLKIRNNKNIYLNKVKKDFKNLFNDFKSFSLNFILMIFYSIIFIFNYFVQEIIGKYGTSPLRIVSSMFVTVFLFTIYYLSYFPIFKLMSLNKIFGSQELNKSFYHSIITFLTIGYGSSSFSSSIANISSNIHLIIASGIEGFLGMFLMAYFTVAFVRKVLR